MMSPVPLSRNIESKSSYVTRRPASGQKETARFPNPSLRKKRDSRPFG